MISRHRHPRILLALVYACLGLLFAGCASTPSQPASYELDYISRATSSSHNGVTASASVLSAEESREVYGVDLAAEGIQPVWVKVENQDDRAYWLMSVGLDPHFFPPTEAAELFDAHGQQDQLERRFRGLAFRNPVPPGGTVSGFVLTNLDEGLKMVQIDLVASGRLRPFSFLIGIPGFRADYNERDVFVRYLDSSEELTDYSDADAFRRQLEALPCCVTNRKGTRNGDPLNLIIVGGVEDAFPALVRRGWRPTEQNWSGAIMKMMTSALSGQPYLNAPVSSLYLYDRPQDLALQRARDNIHQRNHLRLWLSPMSYQGKPVWVGQISRDIGTRLTIHSPYLTTHKIDPNVDEARTALTEDMAYSQNLAKIGLVSGVGAASREAPRRNLTRDPYYTDGFRTVLIFDDQPRSLAEIEFLPWESRSGGFIEQLKQDGQ
ncbi:MAG: LssY C-terminal domain-containing protein [Gammaproteobacteria bacterium]|jgi:hypothetical protein